MGFPSGGCQTCRARHIKCDETRPTCLNCQRSGKNCAGWRTGSGSLLFLNENIYASSQARRPRGGARWVPEFSADNVAGGRTCDDRRSSKKKSDLLRQNADTVDLVLASKTDYTFSISPSLHDSLEDVALHYFARIYFNSDTPSPENLWTIARKFFITSAAATKNDALKLSMSALSLAHFANTRRVPSAMLEARLKYSNALQHIRSAIENRYAALTDELLISIMVMAAYEHHICNFDQENLLFHAFQHHNGALVLLKLRKEHRSTKCSPNSIDQCIRRQMLKTSVYRGAPIPDWLMNGSDFGEEDYQLGLDHGVVALASLRSRTLVLLEACKNASEHEIAALDVDLDHLIEDAIDSLYDLHVWRRGLAPQHMYKVTSGELKNSSSSLSTLFYSSEIFEYSGVGNASMWARYRGTRLFVCCLLKKLIFCSKFVLGLDPHKHAKIEEELHADVRTIATETCVSVPYAFDIDFNSTRDIQSVLQSSIQSRVYPLVWSFVVITGTPVIDEWQRQWVREKLVLIGKVTGNSTLEKLANIDLQFHSQVRYETLLRGKPPSQFS